MVIPQSFRVRHPASRVFERKGFTLIELLIVIAIILILVAIALPNFYTARIRAQVTRVKADMKTIATAMGLYHGQYGRYINSCYPCVPSDELGDLCVIAGTRTQGCGGGFGQGALWLKVASGAISELSKGIQLTSPTPFLTELPFDPFMTAALTNPDITEASAIYYGKNRNWTASDFPPVSRSATTYGPFPYNIELSSKNWVMHTFGPDLLQDGNQPGYGNLGFIYSPTNGAKSYGDIRYYSDRGFLDEVSYSKSYSP